MPMSNTLLPLGKTLDHDGQSLHIIRRVGSGLTGEVFEAELTTFEKPAPIRVAVKAMRALEFPMAREKFLEESETLAFLMHLEDEVNEEQKTNLKIAPVYYGRGEYEGIPYLIQEFIEGKTIPDLLPNSHKFSEKQALVIAWHLFRTLRILHNRLKKTYIDLKFENLWWVENPDIESEGQLKVTDFGTLEEISSTDKQQRGVQRDLLLGAVFLIKMTTGFTPDYSLGILREKRETIDTKINESGTSWGTRQLLKRLLHRNPEIRIKTAKEIETELRILVDRWVKPVENSLEIARKLLERAEEAQQKANELKEPLSKEGVRYANLARAVFDIVAMRSEDLDLSFDLERVNVILDKSGYLDRGRALLLGRSYSLAKQVFQEGMEWNEESAILRRWAYLAEVGEEVSPTIFEANQDKAFEAIGALNQGSWQEAKMRLGDLEVLSSQGLKFLNAECGLFSKIGKAENAKQEGLFEQAAISYREAEEYLLKLPEFYIRFICDVEIGDLKNLAFDMDAHLEEGKKFQQAMQLLSDVKQSIETGNRSAALEQAKQTTKQLQLLGRSSEARSELTQMAVIALQRKDYHTAFGIAQIIWARMEIDPERNGDLQFSKSLSNADMNLGKSDLSEFRKNMLSAISYMGDDDFYIDCVNDLVVKAESIGLQGEKADLLETVADIVAKLDDSVRADEIKGKAVSFIGAEEDRQHARIDLLLSRIDYLTIKIDTSSPEALNNSLNQAGKTDFSTYRTINLFQNEDANLIQVKKYIEEARQLSFHNEYRIEEIQSRQSLVENLLPQIQERLTYHQQEKGEENERNLRILNNRWSELDRLIYWGKLSQRNMVDNETKELIYSQIRKDLIRFMVACYSFLQNHRMDITLENANWQEVDQIFEDDNELGSIESLITKAQNSLNNLSSVAWDEVQREAQEAAEASRASENILREIQISFENGELAKTSAELDALAYEYGMKDEYRNLHAQVMQVHAWQSWQRANAINFENGIYQANLVGAIRKYLSYKLPQSYWSASEAEKYLAQLIEGSRQTLKHKLGSYQKPEYIDLLKACLDASWTDRLNSSDLKKWDPKSWMRKAFVYSQKKDRTALANFINLSSVPENIDAALGSLSQDAWENAAVSEKMRQRRNKIIGFGALGIFIISFICILVINAFRSQIGQMVNGTYTPTITPSPTITPTMTASPTLTPSPTATLTPTPLPVSGFLVTDPSLIYPEIPVAADVIWMFSPERARAIPDITDKQTWTRKASADPNAGNALYYHTQKESIVSWEMDAPLPGGRYQVFVLDTRQHSGGYGEQIFNITLDQEAITPLRGRNSVYWGTLAKGQRTDDWLSLGVYQVSAGQMLAIQTNAPALSGNAQFALGQLVVVKLAQPQIELYDALPSERVLVNLLDDSRAQVYNAANNTKLNNDYQGLIITDPRLLGWNEYFRTLQVSSLDGISNQVSVIWESRGLVPAGRYQLLVWIPSEYATAFGEYSVLLDNKPLVKEKLPVVNQKDHANIWWQTDMWEVPEDGAISVVFTVDVQSNLTNMIGIDAVALVKVD